MTKLMTRRQLTMLDNRIEEIFRRRCSGLQIGVLDISKIFKAGREAHAAGQDVEAAVVAKTLEVRR